MSESTEEQKEVALSSTLRLLQKSRERMQNNNGTKTRKLRASAGAGSHLLKRERCAGSLRSHKIVGKPSVPEIRGNRD